jgi:hypothetical protein
MRVVHDLIHVRQGAEWVLGWVAAALEARGLSVISNGPCGRMVMIVARRN